MLTVYNVKLKVLIECLDMFIIFYHKILQAFGFNDS